MCRAYISYDNVSQVHHAYCHDLYHSAEFLYTQFSLQSLYSGIQFPLTQCELQQRKPHVHTIFIQTISTCSAQTRSTMYIGSKALHPHTSTLLTHQAVGARSFRVQSGFIACDLMVILLAAIASFPIPWCPLVK